MFTTRPLQIAALVAVCALGSMVNFALAQSHTPTGRSGGSSLTADSASFGLIGNDRILWVYQHTHSDRTGDVVRFAYRTAEDPARGRFWRGPVATGRVVRSAVRGADIHLFFSDGSHHRFAPVRIGTTPVIQPRAREIDLPDSALPIALTADQPRGWLFALVPSRVAQKIIIRERQETEAQDQRTRTREDPSSDREPPNSGLSDTAALRHESDLLLMDDDDIARRFDRYELAVIRYQQGRWHFDRHAPVDLTLGHAVPVMLAADAHVHLLYRAPGRSQDWYWRSSSGSDADWTAPARVFTAEAPVHLAAGWLEDIPIILVAEAGAMTVGRDTLTVRGFRADADLWSATHLTDSAGSPSRFSDPLALSIFKDHVAVVTLADDGVPLVSQYTPETGRLTGTPAVVSALIEPPTPRVSPGARQFLQYAVLAAALMAVFVWRRDRVLLIAPIKSDQAFARMDHRFTAFSLDLLILAPIWVPMLYALWRSGAPDVSASEQLVMRQDSQAGPLFWSGAMVGAIFGLYAGIMELIMGRTFGKRIVGCRVVREDGEPCHAQAIFIRNAARIVEFHFVALVLLVVFTPGRQRLGDLLARTVVVEPRIGPPQSPDTDLETDRDEDHYDSDRPHAP